MSALEQLLKEVTEEWTEEWTDERLKEKAEKFAQLEHEVAESQQKYYKKLILYRCLQSIATGQCESESQLTKEIRSMVADILATSEWKAISEKSSQFLQFNLIPETKPPRHFDEIVAKCISSKVENLHSILVSLIGEIDSEESDQAQALRDEIASLERIRCKHMLDTQTKLLHCLQELSEKAAKEENLSVKGLENETESVEFLLEMTDALSLKAKSLQLEVLSDMYPKKRVEEAEAKRLEQLHLREDLEKQIGEAKWLLGAFENVTGEEYNELVKEYQKVQDQIEQHTWTLKEVTSSPSGSK